eukprot:scaffold47491_cov31-Prasinocladus_malaysianus.AAC.2
MSQSQIACRGHRKSEVLLAAPALCHIDNLMNVLTIRIWLVIHSHATVSESKSVQWLGQIDTGQMMTSGAEHRRVHALSKTLVAIMRDTQQISNSARPV